MGSPVTASLEELPCCPICKASIHRDTETVEARDPFGVSNQPFQLIRCIDCPMWLLNARPTLEAMEPFYDEGFLAAPDEMGSSPLARLAAWQQRFNLRSEVGWLLEHLPRGARYVDISCGNGQILERMAELRSDVDVYATEFSPVYRAHLEDRLGEQHVREDVGAFPAHLRFDLASAFGVFEHVDDPTGFVRQIRNRLVEGGNLLLTVPNPNSVQCHLTGRRWYSWLAPRHWQLCGLSTLEQVLTDAGFHVVDRKHFFLRTSSSSLVLSLFPGLDPLLRGEPMRLLAYAALFYAFIPLELLFAGAGRAGFMGVVAERRE